MSRNLGIVTEFEIDSASIFNMDTLEAVTQIKVMKNPTDVDVTNDFSKAVVTSSETNELQLIDLTTSPLQIIDTQSIPAKAYVTITPNNKYAILTGGPDSTFTLSYDIENKTILSELPNVSESSAISPNGTILTISNKQDNGAIKQLNINDNGLLIDEQYTISSGGNIANNIIFSPDAKFAFISNTSTRSIGIVSTINPHRIGLVNAFPLTSQPQGIVMSADGKTLYVYTDFTIDIFTFDSSRVSLTLERRIAHGLRAVGFFGGRRIVLNSNNDRLFLTAGVTLNAFTTAGEKLGTIPDIRALGGMAVPTPNYFSRAYVPPQLNNFLDLIKKWLGQEK
ncbi:hypothetical protein EJF36_12845 [Bacillus sp. HMF5848]|uniref:WD40 repeat domain-containing protein n=1 Tax=Bacillus sp. HMF5848 TaxID=2495421 RepID=UPI000F77467F|nr:WD40 repeat domain-containing protein [Bacillus sp. HMF5848]RSK27690.1 hypothetical protein EJF36_12845 [Bacillus sp. HMF5848]